jgi:predicted Zn-dependent protease
MNHIRMLLKSSDGMAVRRVVFVAGVSRGLVTPLFRQTRTAKMQDWSARKPETVIDSPVRINVGIEREEPRGRGFVRIPDHDSQWRDKAAVDSCSE